MACFALNAIYYDCYGPEGQVCEVVIVALIIPPTSVKFEDSLRHYRGFTRAEHGCNFVEGSESRLDARLPYGERRSRLAR